MTPAAASCSLDLVTCSCAVLAPEVVHGRMAHFLTPYATQAVGEPDAVLTISVGRTDSAAAARKTLGYTRLSTLRSSHPEHRYQVWTNEGRQIFLPERSPDHIISTVGNHVSLTAETQQVAATVGVRIVRQLMMRGGEVLGGRCVHAGAVDIDGVGFLVGGHSGAGKTSTLTSLIEHHGARPVANDRSILVQANDRSWYAAGVPLAWRFTPEGIHDSPKLDAAMAGREPSRGRAPIDGKIELTPWEVSHVFDRPTLAATRVARVVLLARSRDHRKPIPDAAYVKRCLDFGGSDFFAEDWLNVRPQLRAPRGRSSGRGEGLWADLAATVPVQVLTWTDPAELPHVARAIVADARQ